MAPTIFAWFLAIDVELGLGAPVCTVALRRSTPALVLISAAARASYAQLGQIEIPWPQNEGVEK